MITIIIIVKTTISLMNIGAKNSQQNTWTYNGLGRVTIEMMNHLSQKQLEEKGVYVTHNSLHNNSS